MECKQIVPESQTFRRSKITLLNEAEEEEAEALFKQLAYRQINLSREMTSKQTASTID